MAKFNVRFVHFMITLLFLNKYIRNCKEKYTIQYLYACKIFEK